MTLLPPQSTPPPDYSEKRNLATTPTGEISLDDLRHELKMRARRRRPKLIAQLAAVLSTLGLGGTGTWHLLDAKSNAALAAYKTEQDRKAIEQLQGDVGALREKLERTRLKLSSCCATRERE